MAARCWLDNDLLASLTCLHFEHLFCVQLAKCQYKFALNDNGGDGGDGNGGRGGPGADRAIAGLTK